MSRALSIDIETYSSANLKTCGLYKYVESPDFTILLFAYSWDDSNEVEVVDLASGEALPEEVQSAFLTPDIIKCAHNVAFERACISKHFGFDYDFVGDASHWSCTMVKSAMLGLPMSLAAVAKVLQLGEQKDAAGKKLITYFSVPCKPTKTNGERTRNLPEHAPDKWAVYKEYCRQDVVVEKAIRNKLKWYNPPAHEIALWNLDQQINDRGVLIDRQLVENAIRIDADYRKRLTTEAVALTGLNNPNSGAQLRDWLETELNEAAKDDLGICEAPVTIETLRKADVVNLLKGDNPAHVSRLLEIRQEMAKTSIKKYAAMVNYMCADNRARGLLQFCGAGRTWRWAGRGIQLQNMPRIELSSACLDIARRLVRNEEAAELEMLFGNIPDVLSQLLRTALIAKDGSRLLVADFSAIEARVIAWLAGEQWRIDVFNTHGKIYEASASAMFKVPLDKVTKELRQRGKVAELALGYQGGPNALISMGALDKGVREEELQPMVNAWRAANPAIVQLWEDMNEAAITAVETGQVCGVGHGVSFYTKNNVLFMQLPSGRALAYLRPKLKTGKFGGQAVSYEGIIQKTNSWGRIDMYGGKWAENAVQAIARDCLAHAMVNIADAGYDIALHVHDEIGAEAPDGFGSLEELYKIMARPIPWAPGLPLSADGFESVYYKK